MPDRHGSFSPCPVKAHETKQFSKRPENRKEYIEAMKTIITIITILVFCFIVYKKKLSPILSKRKEGQDASPDAGNANPEKKPPSASGSPPIPLTGLPGDGRMRYEVAVFDYAECDSAATFSDYIEARLTVLTSRMTEKGYPYRIDFITIGTALIALITYQV